MNKRELMARLLGIAPLTVALRRLVGSSCLVGLTYHRIGEVDDFDEGIVSTSLSELEWQVRWLRDHVRVLGGDEVVAYVRGELKLRDPAVFLTFDDGYADNVQAGELLTRYQLPGFFFVTTGLVGTRNISEWDRLAFAVHRTQKPALEVATVGEQGPWRVTVRERESTISEVKKMYRTIPNGRRDDFVQAVERAAGVVASENDVGAHPMFMRWDEVKALHQLGHTIGAHSHSHPILSTLPAEQQREEMTRSRRLIEEATGAPVRYMAYPVGKPHTFTEETKRLARECGYEVAFSFYGGRNLPDTIDPFDVKRQPVERDVSRHLFRARAALSSLYPI